MLNGKFYTGLPVAMMDRKNGPNRQQSHFYWPDESDMEAAVDTRHRLRNKTRNEQTPEKTIVKEVNPNDLHKKELASKINLNDNLPNEKVSTSVVKSVTTPKPVNIKRRDTFTSRIQFYDFENEPAAPRSVKADKNSKIEVEKNFKNSNKMSDKRISFTENNLREKSPTIHGLLKNNETSSKLKERLVPIKPAIKNISKSKSMNDVSAGNVKIIENNVKNLKISRDENQNYYEPDELPAPRRQIRTPSRPGPSPRRVRPVTEYYDDIDDDYCYAQRKGSPGLQKPMSYRRSYRDHEVEPDFYDLYDRHGMQTSHQQHYNRRVERRQNGRGHDYEDDYDYRYDRCRSETPKRTILKESFQTKLNHNGDCNSAERTKSRNEELTNPPPAAVDRNIDEGEKPNNLNHNTRNRTITPPTTQNRIQSRAHRHLISNVAFWSDAETNNNSTKTIRNSAVTRVSVGLPDT